MTEAKGEVGAVDGGGGRSGEGAELHGSKPSYPEPARGLSAVKLPLPKPLLATRELDVP